jgi:hypothetical protein
MVMLFIQKQFGEHLFCFLFCSYVSFVQDCNLMNGRYSSAHNVYRLGEGREIELCLPNAFTEDE